MELKIGQKVNLTIGSQATIVKELGLGGQGIVYLVSLNGAQMALKWYTASPTLAPVPKPKKEKEEKSVKQRSTEIEAKPIKDYCKPMELHKAIKKLLEEQGKDILFGDTFVNALSDYNAFEDNPAHKNILRIICKDGYVNTFKDKGTWQEKADKTKYAICQDYCWPTATINYLFDCIAFGLNYVTNIPYLVSEESKTELKQTKKSKKKGKEVHLKIKGIEICGHPDVFYNQLITLGYEKPVFCDDFFTMEGEFAGNSQCKLWVHFNRKQNIVYRVKVEFPTYQSVKRVVTDYKTLKNVLTTKYGTPESEENKEYYNWTSKFQIDEGLIVLTAFGGYCKCNEIDYYDDFYDKHNGLVQDTIAAFDL